MSEFQIVQPNTWTPLVGTDVEVLVDGVDQNVCVDAELYRNDRGEQLVEFSIATHADAGSPSAPRGPAWRGLRGNPRQRVDRA